MLLLFFLLFCFCFFLFFFSNFLFIVMLFVRCVSSFIMFLLFLPFGCFFGYACSLLYLIIVVRFYFILIIFLFVIVIWFFVFILYPVILFLLVESISDDIAKVTLSVMTDKITMYFWKLAVNRLSHCIHEKICLVQVKKFMDDGCVQ